MSTSFNGSQNSVIPGSSLCKMDERREKQNAANNENYALSYMEYQGHIFVALAVQCPLPHADSD